jgi:hypothetical protein
MIPRQGPSRLAALLVLASLAAPAHAADTGGCDSFAFPLATELAWMKADDALAATSGAKFDTPPGKAMAVTLSPTAGFAFTVPPTGKAKNKPEDSFAALLAVTTVDQPGVYQVSLSGPGWIDVIQNGAALKPTAHTGKSDCEGLRKSVRFELAQGPLTVQLSDVPASSIRVTIRKAD